MVDKITTVRRARLGAGIGRLDDGDMLRLSQAVLVFLGVRGIDEGQQSGICRMKTSS